MLRARQDKPVHANNLLDGRPLQKEHYWQKQLSHALPCPAICASGDSAQHLCTHSFIPKALPWALHPSQSRQGKWKRNCSKHRNDIPHENTAVNKQVPTQTGFVGEGRKSSTTFYLHTAPSISGAKPDFLKHRGQQQSSLSHR